MDAGALRAFEVARILDALGSAAKRPLEDERLQLVSPMTPRAGGKLALRYFRELAAL